MLRIVRLLSSGFPPVAHGRRSPRSIEPVIPTAEAAEASGASLRDLAGFRASYGRRQASLSLDLEGGQRASA